MKKNTLGIVAAILSNVIFGTGIMMGKLILNVSSPFMMLSCRFCLAWLVMTILALLKIIPLDLKKPELKLLVLLGIFHPVLNFICESYGLKYSSVSFAGTMLAASPLGAMLLGYIVLKEKVGLKQFLWSLICIAGVIMLSVSDLNDGGTSIIGIIFLLGEITTLAVHGVLSKKLSAEFSPFERTYVMQTVGAIVYTSIAAIEAKGCFFQSFKLMLSEPSFVYGILFLGIVSSVGAICLQNYALGKLPVGEAAIFNSLMTVVSVLMGVVFLSEPFGAVQIIGTVLILVGIYFVAAVTPAE